MKHKQQDCVYIQRLALCTQKNTFRQLCQLCNSSFFKEWWFHKPVIAYLLAQGCYWKLWNGYKHEIEYRRRVKWDFLGGEEKCGSLTASNHYIRVNSERFGAFTGGSYTQQFERLNAISKKTT